MTDPNAQPPASPVPPATVADALAATLPELVIDLARADNAARTWTDADRALTRRILADRYMDDLQTYGAAVTFGALADALAIVTPHAASAALRAQMDAAATTLAIFASGADHAERRTVEHLAASQEPRR